MTPTPVARALPHLQLLKNICRVCWKWKNADIICYKLTLLVSHKDMSKNPKSWLKSMKPANFIKESLHIFWTTCGISMKFSGMMWIILKVTKNQEFTIALADTFLKKPQEGSNCPPSLFRIKSISMSLWLFLLETCKLYIFAKCKASDFHLYKYCSGKQFS